MKRQIPVIIFILISIVAQAYAQVIWQKLSLPETGVGIQAAPNGKLYASTLKTVYVSIDGGSSWNMKDTFPVNQFSIDSNGIFCSIFNDSLLLFSTDEGKQWSNSIITPRISSQIKYLYAAGDSLYWITYDGYGTSTGDYGRHQQHFYLPVESPYGSFEIEVTYLNDTWAIINSGDGNSTLPAIYSINRNIYTSLTFSTGIPFVTFSNFMFDYGGYGYCVVQQYLLRSSDDGFTWGRIDSIPQRISFWPPYIPSPNAGIIIVNDSITEQSLDHAETWKRVGNGISGINQQLRGQFADRKGNVYLVTDSALFRMSLFATVHSATSPTEDIFVHFDPALNQISLQSEQTLGSTTASLYSIDGRLLKRTKLDITSPGEFSIDVSDVHAHFAILVLQTEKGVITKKIFF